MTVVLAIDPGSRITGYALVHRGKNEIEPLDYGCIKMPAHLKLSDRYLILFEAIDRLIALHSPQDLAVESQFIPLSSLQRNIDSVFVVGMARGVALIAAKKNGLRIFQYAPSAIKKAAVGHGRASKQQVQQMIVSRLKLKAPPPEDAADALALGICHLNRQGVEI